MTIEIHFYDFYVSKCVTKTVKLSHIGDLVHHLLFPVLQHHHELALVEARDEKAKKRAPEKEKKNWRVAIVRLANV